MKRATWKLWNRVEAVLQCEVLWGIADTTVKSRNITYLPLSIVLSSYNKSLISIKPNQQSFNVRAWPSHHWTDLHGCIGQDCGQRSKM